MVPYTNERSPRAVVDIPSFDMHRVCLAHQPHPPLEPLTKRCSQTKALLRLVIIQARPFSTKLGDLLHPPASNPGPVSMHNKISKPAPDTRGRSHALTLVYLITLCWPARSKGHLWGIPLVFVITGMNSGSISPVASSSPAREIVRFESGIERRR